MKRFKVGRSCREKLTTDIQFPLKGLNLAPFLSSDKDYSENGRRPPLYDLMGVSHHNGTMHGGHYVATIDTNYSNIGGQRWVNFNDSKVTGVGVNSLSGPSAYVLFYKLQEV